MKISVVISTYNPDAGRLSATLQALACQTLVANSWECVIVDNASKPELSREWCQAILARDFKLLREPTPGLSHARLAGIRTAAAELVVFCDDDNVLAPDYLEQALSKMEKAPRVGAAGGKSLPRYLAPLPVWYEEGMAPLGCRDLGNALQSLTAAEFSARRRYPDFAPIGAGMVFRKHAVESWAATVGKTSISDRKGKNLSSAGDCDMVLHALASGCDAAYWPELVLEHLIPEERLTENYLGAISRAAYRDFVRVLDLHGIQPWPAIPTWSVPLRAAKAWFTGRAWRGPVEQIRWQGAIGQFEGRSQISSNP